MIKLNQAIIYNFFFFGSMKLDLFVFIVPNNHLCHIKSDDYIQIEDFQLELEKIISTKYNA